MLRVLFDNRQDTRRDYAMCPAEVMIDFCKIRQVSLFPCPFFETPKLPTLKRERDGLLQLFQLLGEGKRPRSGRAP
jgi:hypothetical protein